MDRVRYSITLLLPAALLILAGCDGLTTDQALAEKELACKALTRTRNLMVLA